MKIAILGDTHFGVRNDSPAFHNYFENFYTYQFFPYLVKNKIEFVVQTGDLFDRRKYINFNTLSRVREYFFDKFYYHGIHLTTYLGNHDVYYKNTLNINSSDLLLGDYRSRACLDIVQEPETMKCKGLDIDFIPWICDDNRERCLEYIKKSQSQICFGHFELNGFEMDKGMVCSEGMSADILTKYDVVISGHFHHKSSKGGINYVGTPYELTWADYNDPRGFHIFDTETRELEFIRNNIVIHHKLFYDDENGNLPTIDDRYKDTFVKIVVLNKTNAYTFDKMLNELQKFTSDIDIVEDLGDLNTISTNVVDEVDDTVTMIGKYIDGVDQLNADKNKLKLLMRELYLEAVNTSQTE